RDRRGRRRDARSGPRRELGPGRHPGHDDPLARRRRRPRGGLRRTGRRAAARTAAHPAAADRARRRIAAHVRSGQRLARRDVRRPPERRELPPRRLTARGPGEIIRRSSPEMPNAASSIGPDLAGSLSPEYRIEGEFAVRAVLRELMARRSLVTLYPE